MEKPLRISGISAGGIVIYEDRILLVRARDEHGKIFLVPPGGGVQGNEGINQAAVREVWEETGLEVTPRRILFVEYLALNGPRTCKIWFLCDLIGGQLADTQGAKEEGIIEAGWYRRNQLNNEVVYPSPLLTHDWSTFFNDIWESIYIEQRRT